MSVSKSGPAMASPAVAEKREIVQVIREITASAGMERVALELAHAFSRRQIPNRILGSKANDLAGLNTMFEPVAPWLGRIPTRGIFRYLGRLVAVPLFSIAATWAASKRGDAIIISHGDCLVADIMVVHAVNAESLALKRRAGDWRWLLNPIHFWVLARDRVVIGGLRPRMFVAVSKRTARELETHYRVPPDRITVIPNGVDLARFAPDPLARALIRAELSIPAEAKVMLFAGHEFARKGLAFVVEALDALPCDTWLVVVGSDNATPYRSLAHKARERVIFTGARRDMPRLYAAADIFVLPTLYETFSLVCMEALASGLPILATRTGGIEDYLDDGENGFFVERTAADVAAKAALLLADSERLARFAAKASETAQRFGWNGVGAAYLALIASLSDRVITPQSAE